jgi:hypothetical protein
MVGQLRRGRGRRDTYRKGADRVDGELVSLGVGHCGRLIEGAGDGGERRGERKSVVEGKGGGMQISRQGKCAAGGNTMTVTMNTSQDGPYPCITYLRQNHVLEGGGRSHLRQPPASLTAPSPL